MKGNTRPHGRATHAQAILQQFRKLIARRASQYFGTPGINRVPLNRRQIRIDTFRTGQGKRGARLLLIAGRQCQHAPEGFAVIAQLHAPGLLEAADVDAIAGNDFKVRSQHNFLCGAAIERCALRESISQGTKCIKSIGTDQLRRRGLQIGRRVSDA